MDTLALIDLETSGLDPRIHHVVEVGVVLYSVPHACVVSAWSDLVRQPSNDGFDANRIPAEALPLGLSWTDAIVRLRRFTDRADALVAHHAEFDSSFLPDLGKIWICSMSDLDWPASSPGDSLVKLALAHGVPVTHSHRALTDCMLLARVFEAAARHHGADVPALLERATRPRGVFQAVTSYEERDATKAAGFRWDPVKKWWTRRMAVEDAPLLPFPTRRIDA